jgi:hypothetical protein
MNASRDVSSSHPMTPNALGSQGSHTGLYLAQLDLSEPHLLGVAAKIDAQMKALRDLPGSIELLFPSKGSIRRGETIATILGQGRWGRRLAHYVFFHLIAAKHARDVDYVYLRYQRSSPALLGLLRSIRRSNPRAVVLVELPTYPYDDELGSTMRGRIFSRLDRLWRGRVFRYVDRVVTFSSNSKIFGTTTIQTENGVASREFPLSRPSPPCPTLRLVGVANLSYWHGYDRVIEGLRHYYTHGGTRNVEFDIVGVGAELEPLKELAKRGGIESRVRFHGPLCGDELSDLLANCHVGISCIALHRKTASTSDLKSREYCARGLPFVIGYSDRDFPGGFQFAHHVPPDDSALDIGGIVDFYEELLRHQDYRLRMRQYAEQHLDWSVKMEPVLAVLRQLLSERAAADATNMRAIAMESR